jgi:hypothetical protein
MSLTSWILDQITSRRTKHRSDLELLDDQDVRLYLRRLEDRRVLSVTAVDDAYFVDALDLSPSVSAQLGVLSNDVDNGTPLFAQGGTFSTDQGGTVVLNTDGSFDYFKPLLGTIFVDQFTYTASDGTNTSSPATVQIFVGEVPVAFDQPTLIPIFGVETETPDDIVQVNLFSLSGGSLTVLNPSSITFDSGANGDSAITISGTAHDVNKALDTLEYTPPPLFLGVDDLYFDYTVIQGVEGGGFQIVPLVVGSGDESFPEPEPSSGTLVAIDDAYYVDPAQGMFLTTEQSGLLSNDFSTEPEAFIFAVSETVTTDLGGTVQINFDGSFIYTPPNLPQGEFVDGFVYTISNEIDFASAFAVLYVGQVPAFEDVNAPLPLFTVESFSPQEFVTVELTSDQGASLTLFNTAGIAFDSGNNGDSSFIISGLVHDVNLALDSLDYLPPMNFSGDDTITFQYEILGQQRIVVFHEVPIVVEPIADPPVLSITPNPVEYKVGESTPIVIDVALTDRDGSEIPGLVILEFVPAGVVPSAGQQSPFDPETYFILPGELDRLSFIVDAAAPETFTILVTATSIETTDEPGEFGGPGGPLLPEDSSEPRFAFASQTLSFVRLDPPEAPEAPPTPTDPPETVFLLGPLSAPPPPPPRLLGRPPGPPEAPPPAVGVISFNETSANDDNTTTIVVFSGGPSTFNDDVVTAEEENNDQGIGSFEQSGIYVRRLGGDGPGQVARLPEELSEDYARFMAFLRTLPNGDYVVYFKRSGQSHEQAAGRQVVVKVRVVNHRLNPDPGEFKPAGEVAVPPQDPKAISIEESRSEERAELPDAFHPADRELTDVPADGTPISAAAWLAAVAGWKFKVHRKGRPVHVDRLMEKFRKRPSRRYGISGPVTQAGHGTTNN